MEDEFFGEKSFQHCCAEFIRHSQQIGDGWEWRAAKDCSDGYMCKTQFRIKSESPTPHLGTPASVHVCLPTEYGRPLALEDIWEGVHECYKPRLLQGPWDTITQQEHPILGQPFFKINRIHRS
ncbi:Ubiquitin-like-conjugating enzyme ATG10 [Apodemus speciosus]|uniref:Ubiquitin-like-conjugating enzyme ATG10 n=1 Tax=Apodemus speciosus TaxID=105296 RepID=A0ABQ0FGV4_APOSI